MTTTTRSIFDDEKVKGKEMPPHTAAGEGGKGGGGRKVNIGQVIVRGWICYAMVQAGLFGGFLPPA